MCDRCSVFMDDEMKIYIWVLMRLEWIAEHDWGKNIFNMGIFDVMNRVVISDLYIMNAFI